ncbi:MAG: sulfur carrier protein ThiS [Bdellovibrionaceae bacterium]|nr:sulfur carrier protein ThiS [Bdellovibrionales bacterium]MCB9254104.1 sulfur carrier protein ThiS [Pseudobdellovibrionaceae bacterium]
MRVNVNGEVQTVKDRVSVQELLSDLKMDKPYVAVSVNMSCIPKFQYKDFELHENDEIEILVPYQGG